MAEGLHVPDIRKSIGIAKERYVYVNGLFFNGIAQRKFRDKNIGTKTVDFILDGILETLHDQKRDDGGCKPDGEGGDSNRVNCGSQS